MNIPKSFKISGHKITVHMVLYSPDYWGRYWHGTRVVEIVTHSGPIKRRKPASMEQTFWHEAVHAILSDMGHPLNKDEQFVDAFADRLHELTTTARF